MEIVKMENVDKIYGDSVTKVAALKKVNLSIKNGEFISIIGPSGSGKSTLMHLIGCLDMPTSGVVSLNGQDISKLTESELARIRGEKIGFVFQSFNLYPNMTVQDNIVLPMRIHEFDEREIEKRKNVVLKMIGLEHRKNHLPSQLSGGEKQRVAIGRAISTKPSMILADEPTGNLDTKTGTVIMDIFKKLNKEGTTIVLVTHDQSLIHFSNRVIKITDGIIHEVKHHE